MSSTSGTSGVSESWITSFCSLLGHEYFAEVTEEFIEDDFNLTGLQGQVPLYKDALEMILDVQPDDDDDEEEEEDDDDDDDIAMRDENGERIDSLGRIRQDRRDMLGIESSAELLYGLIHQRFINSRQGMQVMADKYEAAHFGFCPRVFCNQARVLPVGLHDLPGQETVKLFCPSCLDVYTPPNSRFQSVDGAFFGTTFGCLFFMSFPDFDLSPKDDPLGLSATHPTFSQPGDSQALSHLEQNQNKHSRSSSLTTTPTTTSAPTLANNSAVASSTSTIVPEAYLPPQPASLNGVATTNIAPGLGEGKIHEPRIYGFRVSERALTGPRMQWLRMRPRDMTELDERRSFVEVYGDPNNEPQTETRAKDINGLQAAQIADATTLGRRKKASVRTRRRGLPEEARERPNGGVRHREG